MNAQTPVVVDHFSAPISSEIWEQKYRFTRSDGTIVDDTVEDTWDRIACALAQAEAKQVQESYVDQFYAALEDFKFLPAGRITSGAGTGRNVTMSNCFVMGTIPDSLEGIFDMLKEAALTMQAGGGIGYDFSTIRPKGALVKGVDADASGPLSFMDVWDTMCKTIMSAGGRRGAMMATMRCDHPDIVDFITAKHDKTRLRHFNVSVLVTDAFMEAVANERIWELKFNGEVYGEIFAVDLWDLIMENTYNHAEPGVIFIDRVNRDHNLNYMETVAATNPCGEKPMAPYSSCLLGSVNLASLVLGAFTPGAHIDEEGLRRLVATAIRMMDNVIDVGKFPLEKQRQKALEDRQLGLGITGLADALFMMGLRYGSQEAADQAAEWMRIIDEAAYQASIDLAQEKGPFPAFDVGGFLAVGTHASRMPEPIQNGIRKFGIRNAFLTSIAPTGTISLYANNVSSGMEPIFAGAYNRRVLAKDGTETFQVVEGYGLAKYREYWEKGDFSDDGQPPVRKFDPSMDLPDYWVTAQELTPEEHVRMQAALQKHIDSSISKTVNLPEDITFDDFKAVYMDAYKSGCKGCTTYRPNEVTGSVLSVVEPEKEEAPTESVEPVDQVYKPEPMERPEALTGATYKLKWPGSDHAFYITISDVMENGQARPFEIFINSKSMEHYQWIVALTRMISAVFRRGGDVSFVVEELKAVFDPRGGAWMKGGYVPSILAAIGGVVEQHMKNIGYIPSDEPVDIVEAIQSDPVEQPSKAVLLCPKCGSSNYFKQGGCDTCYDCGHSGCS